MTDGNVLCEIKDCTVTFYISEKQNTFICVNGLMICRVYLIDEFSPEQGSTITVHVITLKDSHTVLFDGKDYGDEENIKVELIHMNVRILEQKIGG